MTAAVPGADVLAEVSRVGAELVLKEDALAEGALPALLRGSPAHRG